MTHKSTILLVIDENDCPKTDVFALVGLVVPVEQADPIRLAVHRFMHELENAPDRIVRPPPELHGSDMLRDSAGKDFPWANEEKKFQCYEFVTKLLEQFDLHLIRASYYKKSFAELAKRTGAKEDQQVRMRYCVCANGLETVCMARHRDAFVIPIIDSFNKVLVDALCDIKPVIHTMRSLGAPLTQRFVLPVGNVLDPAFVNSRYSSLMQVADVAGYLLQVKDWVHLGRPLNPFKTKLVEIANKIPSSRISLAPRICVPMDVEGPP